MFSRSYLAALVKWRVIDRLKAVRRDADLKAGFMEEVKVTGPGDDEFADREWQAVAMDNALRRIKPSVRPEHYAAFVASTVEGQDTETVMKLYNLSRDNLYQIRKRLSERLRKVMSEVLAEMDNPDMPGPLT